MLHEASVGTQQTWLGCLSACRPTLLCVKTACDATCPHNSCRSLTSEAEYIAGVQVGQFEGIIQHCLSTPGVHVIDLPINYAVSAQLQVSVQRNPRHAVLFCPHAQEGLSGPLPGASLRLSKHKAFCVSQLTGQAATRKCKCGFAYVTAL